MIELTNKQARQFLLLKHGLIGEYKFIGKKGAYEFVRQAGCIQFDPVDACGKNAELTLQSRVKGFTKKTLQELLYEDRRLVDYPDKNLSIMPVEDWPYFARYRKAAKMNGLQFPELAELEQKARAFIEEHGQVSSDELPIDGEIRWHSAIHWSGKWGGKTKASRSVLEQLYSTGELVIHHKKGARKYYDLAEKHIAADILNEEDPLADDFEHNKWRVLRRIGAVGLLWNRPSDAWLNIWGLKTPQRNQIFEELLKEEKIIAVQVDGIRMPLYCVSSDRKLLKQVMENHEYKPRCELIAPLDCFMWDRKLIKAIFDFQYSWEIYTPQVKRQYGFYVLPILFGEDFIGRMEAVADYKNQVLTVKNIWLENGVRPTKKLNRVILSRVKRFAKFNECKIMSGWEELQ